MKAVLKEFIAYAMGQGETSRKKNKHVMYAYWRVLAIYARHIVKFIRKAGAAEPIKYTNATRCKMYPNYIDKYRYFGSNVILLERIFAGEVVYRKTLEFENSTEATKYFEENCGA